MNTRRSRAPGFSIGRQCDSCILPKHLTFVLLGVNMDVLQLLVWLSGAGISAVSAFVLERLSGFQQLSSGAKLLIATTVATVIAIIAMWTHDYFISNPMELIAMNPYLQIVIGAGSIVIQQVAHVIQRGDGDHG